MMIDDLYFISVAISPKEADPELVVDANAVLPDPIAFERLESVAGRDAKVIELSGDLKLAELATRHRLERDEAPDPPAGAERCGIRIPIRGDHVAE